MRRGHAGRQDRAVSGRSWAVRATPTATTSRRRARRRPTRCRSRSICPKNKDGHLVPRRARRTGNVFWGCSNYPKCDFTTNNEPLGGLHDADEGPLARKGDAAICLVCGSTSDTAPDDIVPGERYAGGPPNPEALARPARGARSGGSRGGGRARGTTRGGAREHDATGATDRTGRRRVSAVAGDPATHPTLERFLRSLAARDASPHTIRAYTTAVGAYLDWLGERGVDWTRPARPDLRAYLARLGASAARSTVAQRLAAIRSFHRWAAREGLSAGDPWGAIATPRLPRRLPRVLEVDQVERLLAAVDDELTDAEAASPDRDPGGDRARPARPGARRDGLRRGSAHQ